MPFLLVTGLPSSGKSTVVNRIANFMTKNGKKVEVIREEEYDDFCRSRYNDSKIEKQWRASIRRDVSRKLEKDVLVICDALNYVKGYRYEMFTLGKNAKMTYALLFINAPIDVCKKLNESEHKYTEEKIDELASRYETPDATKRWDSPLITVDISNDSLPQDIKINFDEISSVLYDTTASKPNMCVIEPVEHSKSNLKEAEVITREINDLLLKSQKLSGYGSKLQCPYSDKELTITKHRTPAELNRLRFQFLSVAKSRQVLDSAGNLYVDFLNSMV